MRCMKSHRRGNTRLAYLGLYKGEYLVALEGLRQSVVVPKERIFPQLLRPVPTPYALHGCAVTSTFSVAVVADVVAVVAAGSCGAVVGCCGAGDA